MLVEKVLPPVPVPPILVTLPPAASRRRAEPTALSCLRCQLLGRRRLTCTAADQCARLPFVLPVGPILLAAWLATALAFVVAFW